MFDIVDDLKKSFDKVNFCCVCLNFKLSSLIVTMLCTYRIMDLNELCWDLIHVVTFHVHLSRSNCIISVFVLYTFSRQITALILFAWMNHYKPNKASKNWLLTSYINWQILPFNVRGFSLWGIHSWVSFNFVHILFCPRKRVFEE